MLVKSKKKDVQKIKKEERKARKYVNKMLQLLNESKYFFY